MKKKSVLVIGILGILLVFGAAVALAQNASEKTKDADNHKCTPLMMEDMSDTEGENHCEDRNSDMNSMMTKPMM